MMFKLISVSAAIMAVSLLSAAPSDREIQATYTRQSPQIDGKLTEDVWSQAHPERLFHAKTQWQKSSAGEKKFFSQGVVEPSKFQLLWDEQYLYFGGEFSDSDIVNESPKNQALQYRYGDVIEIFLKPENHSWYWEIHVTPHNRVSSFFYSGGGRLPLGSCFSATPVLAGLKTAAQIQGTLNQPWDRDQKWTVEVAIRRADLQKFGVKLQPNEPWRVFVARYNYSRYLPTYEMSSCPQLEIFNCHFCEDYARLKLQK